MASGEHVSADRIVHGKLTSRQTEVLKLIADGLTNREIAWQLGVSEACVKFHVTGLFRHFGVDNRVSLVMRALAESRP